MLRSVAFAILISLLTCNWAFSFPAKFGLSPDNSKDLLISTIRSAQKQLLINIYQFDNHDIAAAVVDRIGAGVEVQILLEGQPVGNISPEGKKIRNTIRAAMDKSGHAGNHFFVMEAGAKKSRRYVFDHAKYVVVDSKRSLISSENFTSTGHADAGKVGNRGWEVVLENAALASQLERIFSEDTDLSAGDVREIAMEPEMSIVGITPAIRKRTVPPIEQGRGNVDSATLVASPNSTGGIVSLLRAAHKTIELEYMSLPSVWKSPKPHQNPILDELISAARRGVEVRVLLNDDTVFERGNTNNKNDISSSNDNGSQTENATRSHPNELTAQLLQTVSECESLPITAKIVDTKEVEIEYIHNKGVIVDNGHAFISSINGTQNSVINNREVGVIVESRDAAQYFGQAFDFDWTRSPELQRKGRRDCGLNLLLWSSLFGN